LKAEWKLLGRVWMKDSKLQLLKAPAGCKQQDKAKPSGYFIDLIAWYDGNGSLPHINSAIPVDLVKIPAPAARRQHPRLYILLRLADR
jgi:hypothetical protein